MAKKLYQLTEESVEAKFRTAGLRKSRITDLEEMIKLNYFREEKLEIRIASQKKELRLLKSISKKKMTK